MNVAELIEILNGFPKDAKVCLMCSYDDGFGHAGGDPQTFEFEHNTLYICNDED